MSARVPQGARHESLVARVDALWEHGPPDRGVVAVVEEDGVAYFEVRALALRCLGCDAVVPQSRTRISREARQTWLLHHAACTDDTRSP